MILYLRVILFVLFFYRVTIMRKIKIATLFFNFLFLLERITLYKFVLMLFFVCCILHTTNYNTTQNPSRALALFDLFTTHILYLERSSFVFLHSIQKSVLLQKPKSKPNHSFSDLFTSRTENKPYLTYTLLANSKLGHSSTTARQLSTSSSSSRSPKQHILLVIRVVSS